MKKSTFAEKFPNAHRLIMLAMPILLAQMAQNSMGQVDTIMAGRVSATDMAAIAVGASIWFPLVLFGQGLLLALPPTISYLNGSGKRERIAHQVRQGLWIAFIICIPLGIFIYYSDIVLNIMDMEPQLAEITHQYLQAMIFGLPAYLLLVNYRCLNDGIAKTKPAMVITFIGLLLNIPLNYSLIYGKFGMPALGAVGCGYATATVNWIMALLMIGYSKQARSQRDLNVFFPIIEKPHWHTLSQLLRLGFPIALALSSEVALFAITALLLSPLGTIAVASHQIALSTSSMIFMFPLALSMATTIVVGQSLGEKNPEKAKLFSYLAIKISIILATITALITLIFRFEIAQLFVKDAVVIELAATLLVVNALYQFSDAIQAVVGGILRGYKDTKVILYITLFCYWGVGMPVGYSLARTDIFIEHLGPMGFWISFVLALTLAAILLFIRMRKVQNLSDEQLFTKLEK